MTWDAELEGMCTIPVRWEEWFEDRARGARGYKIARTVNCFVAPSAAATQGVFQEALPRQTVIMPPHDAAGSAISRVSARDRITLPDGYGFDEPLTPPIKAAHAVFDEYGSLHHFELSA